MTVVMTGKGKMEITDIFGHTYTRIIKDPTFEARLKNFDPNLRLMFDQNEKNFKILEERLDKTGWNIIVSLQAGEDLDDNIMTLLWLRRQQYEQKVKQNKNIWFDDFLYETKREHACLEEKASQNHRYQLADDRNQWRKAYRELNNMPSADVTAGYPKIEHKQKGKIWNEKTVTL